MSVPFFAKLVTNAEEALHQARVRLAKATSEPLKTAIAKEVALLENLLQIRRRAYNKAVAGTAVSKWPPGLGTIPVAHPNESPLDTTPAERHPPPA